MQISDVWQRLLLLLLAYRRCSGKGHKQLQLIEGLCNLVCYHGLRIE